MTHDFLCVVQYLQQIYVESEDVHLISNIVMSQFIEWWPSSYLSDVRMKGIFMA